jgi:diaminopimelate dehydrogenase
MPNYFADFDTTVHFISAQELAANHSRLPHGGFVLRSGKTGNGGANSQIIEYGLKLESNPEFTASVLAVCARAVYRMGKHGSTGCFTMFDIPPAYYHPQSAGELRKIYL